MASHVAQLKSMFPAIDKESINSVLTHCRNDVNAAIEKLLTFSEDTQKEDIPPAMTQGLQTAVQEDVTAPASSKPVEKRSHTIQQYHWMNLPPLGPTKHESLNETPVISPSPQWVYPHPYSPYGPAQPVATGNKLTAIGAQAPVVKQLPRQHQTVSTYGSHQQGEAIKKKRLIVMRGLPGSGKSTLARKLKGSTGVIFSTDDYYIVDGVYQFDVSKLGEYHEQNQQRAKDAMRRGISPIIIDNTNTKCHEMKPYVAAALQFNYAVEFREPNTPWKFNIGTLLRKNTHGVARVTLERMLDRYEHHVTIDMVMGTNKSSSKPMLPNRDAHSAPVNSSKAGGCLIARSPPVSMPTTQHTSPQLKTKRYSHGNQATSWHGNHSVPPVTSRSDKNNYWRRDDNFSHGYLCTSNHKLDTSRTVKTTDSNLSNNSIPLWTNTTTTTTTTACTNHNITNMGGLLSIDTNVNDLPIQTISSPHSTEVIQQKSHSYPVMSDYTSHDLHHSLSDSLIIPVSAHQCSNEPFHTAAISQSSELPPMCRAEETALSFSLNNQQCGNMCKKWPSTELYHDSDEDFNSNRTDHNSEDVVTMSNDGQMVDNNNNDNSNNVDMTSSMELAGELVDNDIDFLKSCFPNILADQVLTVYNDCERNIETAVGQLLQLPTSPLPKLIDFSEVWQENEEVGKLFQEECSSQAVEEVTEDIQITGTDEEVARALQDQWDKALIEEKSSGLATSKALVSQNEPCSVNGSGEDEGLILRLSPSLASKLQDMFGSVKSYLIADGDPCGDDLVVLLSEKAAKEIHKKWLDTLQAKQIETRYINSIQMKKDTELARQLQQEGGKREDEQVTIHNGEGQWKKHRNKQRKQNSQAKSNSHLLSTKPSSLKEICQQQVIVEQESQQVSEIVSDACKNSIATNIKVKELYNNFPSLNQHYIDQLILEHQYVILSYYSNLFNFEQVSSVLQRIQARKPISVVANPVSKPVKMSPRKHEATTVANDGPGTGLNNSKHQESWNNPSYEDIRAEAALHAKLRAESFQKAAEARNKKQGDLAVFYAQQGHLHTSKMSDANERAAEMILSRSNNDVIDFHGLFVKEAIEALEEKLSNTTQKTLYVVTGKGSHSSGGVAKIKPAVIDYLDKKGYRYETVNEGQIKIFINN